MIRFCTTLACAVLVSILITVVLVAVFGDEPAPAKTETLSCVRVKQVTPAGTINYLCEVRK